MYTFPQEKTKRKLIVLKLDLKTFGEDDCLGQTRRGLFRNSLEAIQ